MAHQDWHCVDSVWHVPPHQTGWCFDLKPPHQRSLRSAWTTVVLHPMVRKQNGNSVVCRQTSRAGSPTDSYLHRDLPSTDRPQLMARRQQRDVAERWGTDQTAAHHPIRQSPKWQQQWHGTADICDRKRFLAMWRYKDDKEVDWRPSATPT